MEELSTIQTGDGMVGRFAEGRGGCSVPPAERGRDDVTFHRGKVTKARRGVPTRPGTPNGSSSAGGLATRAYWVRSC